MSHLEDIRFFVQAARFSSLSEAARRMDVSPAAASATLKRLEAELGLKLMVRTTRNLRLTQSGEVFLTQCAQGLQLIQQAQEHLHQDHSRIAGVVQISLPSNLGRQVVLPLLTDFRQQHPKVELRIQLTDRMVEMHREPIDVVLRYGKPADSSLVALPIAQHNRRVLCATPAYLNKFGAPLAPVDLRQHACLCFQLSDRIYNRWAFDRGGRTEVIEVSGPIVSDDGDAIRLFGLMGEGIIYKSAIDVMDDVKQGLLIPLCTDWQGEAVPLYLACADRSQLRPVVKLLREFLMQRLQALMA
jgi:DNA-binding transcriptional LysR family regulator